MSFEKVECAIGESRFDVYSDPGFARLFRQEFQAQVGDTVPDVVFYISRPGTEEAAAIEAQWSQTGEAADDTVPFFSPLADVKLRLGCPARVFVAVKRTPKMKAGRALPRPLQRILTVRYMTADEQEYVNILYEAVLWVVFLVGLRAQRIFLHASGVELNGMTVLLCGAGGVGKTTLSRCLLSDMPGSEAGFISDDLVQVDQKGAVVPNLMFAHTYPYNTEGGASLADSPIFQRSCVNRLHWDLRARFLGPKSVCRRWDPRELYPNASFEQRSRDLSWIIWLVKPEDYRNPVQHHITSAFVGSHLQVLQKELRNAFRFYETARAAGFDFESVGMPADLDEAVEAALYELCEHVGLVRFCPDKEKAPIENARQLVKELVP